MRNRKSRFSLVLVIALLAGLTATFSAVTAAQTPTRSRVTRPTPTPPPNSDEAVIISRAEDLPPDTQVIIQPVPANREQTPRNNTTDLEERIKLLEAGNVRDVDADQRRLLLNLDILTKAEQRVEGLRKQLFEMIEKENAVQTRIDALSIEARPEMIERTVASTGSLRPEELREARRRQLESERSNLQNLLAEIQRNKANLETSVQRAEQLVDRIRTKLEAEIDSALEGPAEATPERP